MRLWADIYNAAGTLQEPGPIYNISAATITRVLDGVGSVRFSVPAGDQRVQDLIDNERRVHLYTYQNDAIRLLGIGIVRNNQGEQGSRMLMLDGPDQLDELKRPNTLLGRNYYDYTIEEVLDALIALASGWSLTKVDLPSNDVSVRYDGASVLSALQTMCAKYGLHMRWDSDQVLRIGQLGDTAGVRAIQPGSSMMNDAYDNTDVIWIDKLAWKDTTESLANWIIPVGSGQRGSALTLQYSTRGADRYETRATTDLYNLDTIANIYSLEEDDGSPWSKLAQSFIAGDKWLGRIRLPLMRVGDAGGLMTVRIETNAGTSTGSGSYPSGTLVDPNATATRIEASLPEYDPDNPNDWQWATFTFSTPFKLESATRVWIVLSTTRSASASEYVVWGYDNGATGAYAYGRAKYYDGSWNDLGNDDFSFNVQAWVESRVTDAIAEYGLSNWDTYFGVEQSLIGQADIDTSGATPTATSEFSTAPIENAFDGDPDTDWYTDVGVTTATIELDMGTSTTISGYTINADSLAVGQLATPNSWTFDYYDGSWNTVHSKSGYTDWSSDITFDTGQVTGAKFRWQITANNGNSLFTGLSEITLHGNADVTRLAQSFKGDDGLVKEVNLWLAKRGSPTGWDLKLTIQSDSSGEPSGSNVVVSGDTPDVEDIDTNLSKVTFRIAYGTQLESGTTYWIVLQNNGAAATDDTDYIQWAADKSSPGFTDGEMLRYSNGAWESVSADAIFQVNAYCQIDPYEIHGMYGPDGEGLFYLSDSGSITDYGQIEKVLKFDVSPLEHTADGLEIAANALYDAAVAWLQRYSQKQITYELTAKNVVQTLKPGQKLPVIYHGQVVDMDGNSVGWRDIDQEFWITKVDEQFLPAGVTVAIEISDVDLKPADIANDIVSTLEKIELRDVTTRPNAATFTYVYTDLISGPKTYTLSGGAGGGSVVTGKDAIFNLLIPPSVMELVQVTARFKTYPPRTFTLHDTDGYVWYGADEGSNYPAGLSLYIDGTDRSSALGGPWANGSNDNFQWDEEFDITEYLRDANDKPSYGDHLLKVISAGRTISGSEDMAVSGYLTKNVSTPSPAPGMVECTITMQCVTQPIKV